MRHLYYLLVCAFLIVVLPAGAQISITGTLPFSYSENFNSFNGFTPPAGWTASGSFTYRGTGNGSSNTGGVWAYGSGSDYSLGALCSGSSNNINFTVSFTNNTGSTINTLNISYDFKQWRWGGGNNNTLAASQTNIGAAVSSLSQAGTATGGTNGVAVVTPKTLSLTGLSITAGTTFSISWNITDGSGSDNGVAIDNFSLTAGTSAAPCTTPGTPSGFLYTIISPAQTDVSFSAPAGGANGYLVIRSTSNTLSASPVNTTNYNINDAIGGGNVIYKGTATSFSSTGLNPLLDYYYFIFAYNNTNCTGGPLYSNMLSGVDSLPAPVVTADPADTVCCAGNAAAFYTTATNALAYQWQLYTGSWTNLGNTGVYSGANTATLSISNTTGLNGNQYRCIVTGSLSHKDTSAAAMLTVYNSTSITAQPADAIVCAGKDTSFRIHAGGASLSYQWQENQGGSFHDIANNLLYNGATTDSLVLTTTGINMNGYTYRCIIHNVCGQTDTTASRVLTVHANPVASINAAGPLSFCQNDSVLLQTNAGFTYQWLLNGNPVNNAGNNTYAVYNNGIYAVRITDNNGCSSLSSNDTVTVYSLPVAQITPTGNTNICTGSSLTLNANTGTGLSYQWQENGNAISGATNATYTAANNSSYTVVITNSNGCKKTSAASIVTLLPYPVALASATGNTTVCQGGTVSLNTPATNGYTYQWLQNGTPVSNATATAYTASSSGSYRVVVTNTAGCTDTSAAIAVAVIPVQPAVISNAGPLSFCAGDSVILITNALAGATYQWQVNGNNISNAADTAYTAITPGTYTITITNAANCPAVSNPLAVTVHPLPNSVITYTTPVKFCEDGAVVFTASIPSGLNYQWLKDGNAIPGATGYSYIVAQSGNYGLIATNSYNCTSNSAPVQVTVFAKPQPVITRNNYLLSTGNYSTYQWYYNGVPVQGAVSQTYTAGKNGGYAVAVTDSNGCVNRSALMFINNVGIGNMAQAVTEIKIYPNPVSDIVHIEAPFDVRIQVRDLAGKLLQETANAHTADMSALPDGLYFLSIYDTDGQLITTQKIARYSK